MSVTRYIRFQLLFFWLLRIWELHSGQKSAKASGQSSLSNQLAVWRCLASIDSTNTRSFCQLLVFVHRARQLKWNRRYYMHFSISITVPQAFRIRFIMHTYRRHHKMAIRTVPPSGLPKMRDFTKNACPSPGKGFFYPLDVSYPLWRKVCQRWCLCTPCLHRVLSPRKLYPNCIHSLAKNDFLFRAASRTPYDSLISIILQSLWRIEKFPFP